MSEQRPSNQRVIRDGKVAVLVSRGYGAGWYSWNTEHPDCLFHPEIVAMVEREAPDDEIVEAAKRLWGDGFYAGGVDGLTIEWMPQGSAFEVHDYDGAESIRIRDELDWMTA